MKIIWITLESLLPANSGGRLGVYKRLEQISKEDEVYLFYPFDDISEVKYRDELSYLCKEVHAYYRPNNKINAIKMLYKYPYTVASRCIKQMQDDIRKCIEDNEIDIINVDFPHMCVNLLGLSGQIPIVLNEHNIEWKVYRSIAKSKNLFLWKRLLYWIDSYRLKKYEEKVFDVLKIKAVTFVSDKDLNYFNDWIKSKKILSYLVPVGADTYGKKNVNEENIIFVGKMSYGPNIEAAEWFVKDVFPIIKKKIPNSRIYIVGKDPVKKLLELENEDVIVTGTVESVKEYYDRCNLVVIPLKNGGGVKVKLLEAIGYGKNVVSTSVGVEGTLYSDGDTVPVVDDNKLFAEECIKVLQRNEDVIKRQEKYYELFLENYTWSAIGKYYRNVLRNVVYEDTDKET